MRGVLFGYATLSCDAHAGEVAKRLRTLDALQLATALDLWNKHRVDTFVTADQILGDLADDDGLPILNPLS